MMASLADAAQVQSGIHFCRLHAIAGFQTLELLERLN